MNELQKEKLKQVAGWMAFIVYLISFILGMAYEWYFVLFVVLAIAVADIVGCIYFIVCRVCYDWNIRGTIEPDELSTYRRWYYRIHDGEFDFIKTVCEDCELPTILKIEKVKRPKWY